MWLGPIHDPEFVGKVLDGITGQEKEYGTWARMNGMLRLARDVGFHLPSCWKATIG